MPQDPRQRDGCRFTAQNITAAQEKNPFAKISDIVYELLEKAIQEKGGAFIPAGLDIPSLDEKTKWDVQVLVKKGEQVQPGQIIAQCDEKGSIMHKIMVPPTLSGEIVEVSPDGAYTVRDQIALLKTPDGK